jgi:hypothetical protein
MLRIQINASRRPRERPGRSEDGFQEKLRSARECRRCSARGADTRLFYTAWAHPGRHTHASGRQLSGEDRSRQPVVGAAVHDPERRLVPANYRTAKGLFDHLVGAREQQG